MLRSIFLSLFLSFFSFVVSAQINQFLETGWKRDTAHFIISDSIYQLNGPGAGISVISNPIIPSADTITWEFTVKMEFNPSSGNYARVYLSADTSYLDEPLNGYYVMIGDTEDEISLYRQQGNTREYLINGQDKVLDLSSFEVDIKVEKMRGTWKLSYRMDQDFIPLGSYTEAETCSYPYFGFFCKYTSTRKDRMSFSNVSVSAAVEMDSVIILSRDTIVVIFNQDVLPGGHFELNGNTISDLIPLKKQNQILLKGTLHSGQNQLKVSYISDATHEFYYDPEPYEFDYFPLEITTVSTPTDSSIQLIFNQALSSFNDPIFSISPVVELQKTVVSDDQLWIHLASKLEEGKQYEITLHDLENAHKNSSMDTTFSFSYQEPLYLENVEVTAIDRIEIEFNKPVQQIDPSNILLDSGLQIERINILDFGKRAEIKLVNELTGGVFSLKLVGLKAFDGSDILPGLNYKFSYLPLSIVESYVDGNEVFIIFNQKISEQCSLWIEELAAPETTFFVNDSTLSLSNPVISRARYLLNVEAKNLKENAHLQTSIEVFFETQVKTKSLLISEIMADPTPPTRLPEAEYIELYNRNDLPLNLKNFTLNGKILPDYNLLAGDFVVILDDSDSMYFQMHNRIGISTFDALTNTGESVILKDHLGQVIDSLFYDKSWYKEDVKEDGGYSLELINPLQNCHGRNNWIASSNDTGGSPGAINSVWSPIEDQFDPFVLDYQMIRPDSVLIAFSEPIKNLKKEDSYDYLWINNSMLSIKLQDSLESEKYHVLLFKDVEDCHTNISKAEINHYLDYSGPRLQASFFLSPYEVALIFHEEIDEYSAEREENYMSNEPVVKALLQDTARNRIHLSFESSLDSLSLLFQGIGDTLSNASTGKIALKRVQFLDSISVISPHVLQLDLLQNISPSVPENYLLSGLGVPDEVFHVTNEKVRLHFKNSLLPNKYYSLYLEGIKDSSGLKIHTPGATFFWDQEAPKIEKAKVKDSLSLEIIFNEDLDLIHAINILNYKVEGHFPLEVIPVSNRSLLLVFQHPFPVEVETRLEISSIKDISGNDADRKVNFIFDQRAPTLLEYRLYSPDQIALTFHEDLRDTLTQFSILIDSASVERVDFQPNDFNTLIISVDRMPSKERLEIIFTGVEDPMGNVDPDTTTILLNTLFPTIIRNEFLSSSLLEIEFSNVMDFSMMEIKTSIPIDSISLYDEKRLRIQMSRNIEEEEALLMSFVKLFDNQGYPLQNDTIKAIFHSSLKRFFIHETSITLEFDQVIQLDSATFSGFEIPQFQTLKGTEVQLVYASPIPSDSLLILKWAGIMDEYDRSLPDHEIEFVRDLTGPSVIQIHSDFHHQIILSFDEMIDESSLRKEWFRIEERSPIEMQVLNPKRVLLVFYSLVDGKDYHLHYKNITDKTGNISPSSEFEFTYSLPQLPAYRDVIINEILADPTPQIGLDNLEFIELYNQTKDTINLSHLSLNGKILPFHRLLPGGYYVFTGISLKNDGDFLELKTLLGDLIDSVHYSREWFHDPVKAEGGYSLELIDPAGHCDVKANWQESINVNGGTPGFQNSVYSEQGDVTPPFLLSEECIDGVRVSLEFNEKMDTRNAPMLGNRAIHSWSWTNEMKLNFVLEEPLTRGEFIYDTLLNVSDCSGNFTQQVISLLYPDLPNKRELLITEIKYTGDEYLEIYNTTNKALSLESVRIFDPSGISNPVKGVILPFEYKLLVPFSNISNHPSARGIKSWRSLSNTGEWIGIYHGNDKLHALDYSFYLKKDSSDFSLQLGNPANPCGIWYYSKSLEGSPGQPNMYAESIDIKGPHLLNYSLDVTGQMFLEYDEFVDQDLILVVHANNDFFLEKTDSVYQSTFSGKISEGLTSNTLHSFLVGEVIDCNSNLEDSTIFEVFVPSLPKQGLIINELLFNPVTGGSDFIELFNNTENHFLLKGLVLMNQKGDKITLDQEWIIEPGEYVVLTQDSEHIHDQYFLSRNVETVASLPSMNDDEGYMMLYNAEGQLLDSVYYHEDFHSMFLSDTEGVSLERLDSDYFALNQNHWQSSSTASDGATPGYQNSQTISGEPTNKVITVDPRVFTPGIAASSIHYNMPKPGAIGTVKIYNANGALVKTLAEGKVMGQSGYLKWDGSSDSGSRVNFGQYLVIFDVFTDSGDQYQYKERVVVTWD